jgi:squalene-associated FAD-dependent desaturase
MTFNRHAIEDSYSFCRRMCRRAHSSFPIGFLLLPREQRRAMEALYAFMRHTDDLSDDLPTDDARRTALTAWRSDLQLALGEMGQGAEREGREAGDEGRDSSLPSPAGGRGAGGEGGLAQEDSRPKVQGSNADTPNSFIAFRLPLSPLVLPALADAMERFHIPSEHLFAAIDGVEMDLDQNRFATFGELERYCERVASAVGLACIHIWGFHGPEAIEPARQMGVALQLTNILRDLKEDAARGRIYLPLEDLDACGYSADDLLQGKANDAFLRLMRFEIDRAEQFYQGGFALSQYLEPAGRRIFGLMTETYHALLQKIAAAPTTVLAHRIRLQPWQKLRFVARWMLWPPRQTKAKPQNAATPNPRTALSTPHVAHSSGARSLAIVGGGLAGVAAAATAVERGFRVTLFEQTKSLGGRAGSFVDSKTGDRVDYAHHVAMGCCTAFLDFCRHVGIEDCFDRSTKLHFIGPDGVQCDFGPSPWLPAPLHLLPGFWRLNYLTVAERLAIVRALTSLIRSNDPGTLDVWLRRNGQTPRMIERFWSVVLVSALSETVDHIAVSAAQKVLRDGFFASREASEVLLPRVPLGEIFHDRVGSWLSEQGVEVHLNTPVRRIEGNRERVAALILADGTRRPFDFVTAAVPWHRIGGLFDNDLAATIPTLKAATKIEPAAITAVHLWFDRSITTLPHAAFVGRLGQWIFPTNRDDARQHCEVLISASHRLTRRTHDEWLAEILQELRTIWPETMAKANLVHGRVVTQPAAVFSISPETEQLRPQQQTAIPNLSIAGDWTATGWPATMESALRSGRKAIDAFR